MVSHPEIQERAQRDIERITGGQRLPDYGDQKSLPYIQAIIREVLRWKPITPPRYNTRQRQGRHIQWLSHSKR